MVLQGRGRRDRGDQSRGLDAAGERRMSGPMSPAQGTWAQAQPQATLGWSGIAWARVPMLLGDIPAQPPVVEQVHRCAKAHQQDLVVQGQ